MNQVFSNIAIFWKTLGSFNYNVAAIFGITILNILYKIQFYEQGVQIAANLWNPTWLLFGPFIYFANLAKTSAEKIKNISLHYLPTLLFSSFWCLIIILIQNDNPLANTLFDLYQKACLVIPISLAAYALKVMLNKKNIANLGLSEELLVVICTIYYIIAGISFTIYICEMRQIDMGIDYRFFNYTLLLIGAIFIGRYFYLLKYNQENSNTSLGLENSYANSTLDKERANAYIQQIDNYFANTQAFLRSDISLDTLSEDLNISKHYFSQIFNVHIGKNFYSFLAEHRIHYALKLMQKGGIKLKMESLANECGFNSKTSFNRYFKGITGYTPLEYLNLLEEKGQDPVLPLADSK